MHCNGCGSPVVRFTYSAAARDSQVSMDSKGDVTQLLERLTSGDATAEDLLLRCVYAELHRIAERCMNTERQGHTLQPTALVNEAYMRLCQNQRMTWENRVHFYAIAARMMRRILTDYARQRHAAKRGSGMVKVEFTEQLPVSGDDPAQVIAIDDLLNSLAVESPRAARVVEMRFFVGMSEEEIATVLQVSRRTVYRDWLMARAWLHQRLRGTEPGI